jgi:hypothetical protein
LVAIIVREKCAKPGLVVITLRVMRNLMALREKRATPDLVVITLRVMQNLTNLKPSERLGSPLVPRRLHHAERDD